MSGESENPYAAPGAAIDAGNAVRGKAFKFRYVNANGQEVGFRAKKGVLTEEGLVLDGTSLPYRTILRALARSDRLALLVLGEGGGSTSVVVALRGHAKLATAIAQEVGRGFSSYWALRRLEALRAEGREREFRSRTCDHCGATIDLTGIPATPQVYCRDCDSLNSPAGQAPPGEARFHLCDGCGYYSDPAVFNRVVIVFALAVTAWWSSRRFVCRSCMRREAWITLLKNVPTLVGVPFAIPGLVRAYAGGSARSGPLAGLDAANGYARAGKLDRAEALYEEITARVPHAAGVHYNRALARARAGHWRRSQEALDRAQADCANFEPAIRLAGEALTALGRKD